MTADPTRWHRLLERQIRRAGLAAEDIGPGTALGSLLDRVSASYDDTDQQRYLNDRAFELSGREMLELNEQLRRAGASELALERDRLQAVFDSVATGLVVVDSDRHVVDLNLAARALLGVDALGSAGTPLEAVLGPSPESPEAGAAFASLVDAMAGGHRWRGADLALWTAAGIAFPGNIAFSPLFDDDLPAGGVLSISDVSERAMAAAELAWRATHDALTGLLNRTALMEQLNSVLDSHAAGMVGIMFLDLDRFKLVNDTLGHAAGDRLLITAVDRIMAVIRDDDVLARLGGDEFVVLCERAASPQEVMSIADRVVAALAHPFALGSDIAYVSASIGVTVSTRDSDAASLLRDADVALYRAKDGGRGRAVLFDQSMRDQVAETVRLERQLRHALDSDGLSLAYQPVFRGDDGRLAGFETLVRWEGPGFEVEPEVFVPLAEDTGLVGVMGDWVLASAAAFLSELHDAGFADLSLAVNVSALQLNDPTLPERVGDVVSRLRAPARSLILEITETALLAEPELARQRISELRSVGVRVSLDDFGTGYSSLSALRGFPLDALKIDRSFVSGVTTSAHDHAIVSAIVELGHALGMSVVAEGVETPEQLAVVRQLGCDRLQGFVLSRPVTAERAWELATEARVPLWDQADGISSGPVLAAGK